jgi:hypothetical protein
MKLFAGWKFGVLGFTYAMFLPSSALGQAPPNYNFKPAEGKVVAWAGRGQLFPEKNPACSFSFKYAPLSPDTLLLGIVAKEFTVSVDSKPLDRKLWGSDTIFLANNFQVEGQDIADCEKAVSKGVTIKTKVIWANAKKMRKVVTFAAAKPPASFEWLGMKIKVVKIPDSTVRAERVSGSLDEHGEIFRFSSFKLTAPAKASLPLGISPKDAIGFLDKYIIVSASGVTRYDCAKVFTVYQNDEPAIDTMIQPIGTNSRILRSCDSPLTTWLESEAVRNASQQVTIYEPQLETTVESVNLKTTSESELRKSSGDVEKELIAAEALIMKKADDPKSASEATFSIVAKALQNYRTHCGCYPETSFELVALTWRPAGQGCWKGPYMTGARLKDIYGSRLQYEGSCKKFKLISAGKDKKLGTSDDLAYPKK